MNWQDILSSHRRRPSTGNNAGDLRTEFEKDYHRIIGSASFRRLQDKTQVFPLDKSDFIRTRLTHSLEVSSFARSLGASVGARILEQGIDPGFLPQYKNDISDILQCAGLIHDIGNPPFGHFGEVCIRQWFKDNLENYTFKGAPLNEILKGRMEKDLVSFDGNAQALRLLTRLHFLIDENGMNLTYALLSSIIKYPCASDNVKTVKKRDGHDSAYLNDSGDDISHKKMGYFYADREIYDDIERRTGLNGHRSPLAFLLEAADDIAYKTADIEDAFKKGFIKYDDLVKELSGVNVTAIEILKNQYSKGLHKNVSDPEFYAVQNFIVRIQSILINEAADSFITHYREIMNGSYGYDLFRGTDFEDLMFLLGDMGWRYVFDSEPIYRGELRTAEIYDFLMNKYVKAVLYYDTDEWELKRSPVDYKLLSLISDNYKNAYLREACDKSEEEKLYLRLLLVTDCISGMTDSYASDLYREIRGMNL